MDITKARAAVVAAQTAVQELFTAAAKSGNTDGIVQLVKANQLLGKANEKLDEAKEKATPKVKEAKEDKAKK